MCWLAEAEAAPTQPAGVPNGKADAGGSPREEDGPLEQAARYVVVSLKTRVQSGMLEVLGAAQQHKHVTAVARPMLEGSLHEEGPAEQAARICTVMFRSNGLAGLMSQGG